MSTPPAAGAPPARPPRSRGWVWFFLILAVLAAVAITVPIVYNLSLQLTPEQLDAAEQLWHERGPRDYDLEYGEKIDDPDTHIFVYRVKVRGGRVISFSCNDRIELLDQRAGVVVGPIVGLGLAGDAQGYSIDGLFREIRRAMREDAERGGRRNYVTATFDKHDGHPVHYVRRVAGKRERVEWNVRLHPVGGAP